MHRALIVLVLLGTAFGQITQNFDRIQANQITANAKSLNGTQFADQFTGASVSAQVNACIAAVIALGGGTCDARAILSGNITSEIDVGNTSGVPVVLLLPPGNSGGTPSWNVTMTDGTSYGLKVFTNSAAISANGTAYNPFFIATGASANVAAVCGNDTTIANAHIRMEGFMCGVYGGSPTVAQAVGLFVGLGDGAYIGHMTFEALSSTATVSKVLWAHGNCCGTAFHSVVAEAFGISGRTPCWFGNNASNDGNLNIGVDHLACVHPGTGAHNLVDQQWAQFTGNVFTNTYMEMMAGADTVTSWVSIQPFSTPTGADTFIGTVAGGDVAASTRYVFDIVSGSKAIIIGSQCGGISANAVNDHNGGGTTIACSAVNASIAGYTTEKQYFNGSVVVGSGAAITSSGAGGTMTATIGSATATMTTALIGTLACGTTVTVATNGVATTDTITWAFNAAPAANPGELVVSAWPTANNVNFQYCNPTAAGVTPNAATLNFRVVR